MHDCAKKASNFFETKWSETEKQLLKDQAAAARKRNKPKPKPRSKPQPKPESPVPREYEIAGSVEAMQERELKGMETLQEYIVECGGKKNCLQGWYCVIEMRREGKTQGTSDMFYFSPKVSVLFISLSLFLSLSLSLLSFLNYSFPFTSIHTFAPIFCPCFGLVRVPASSSEQKVPLSR